MQDKFNIASFSSRRRSIAHKQTDSVLQTPKSSVQKKTQDSVIGSFTPKQYKLYSNIFQDTKKFNNIRSKSETKHSLPNNLMEIQDIINHKVKKRQQFNQFKTMYSIQTPESQGLGKYPFTLETKQQKQKLILKKLCRNPEQLASFYQNQLLQFYHYRDLQKQTQILTSKFIPKDINASIHRRHSQAKNKIDVKYLQGQFNANKHLKITNSMRQTENLYSKHNQNIIQKQKLIRSLKHQKQVKQPVRLARRNMSYKRSMNIDRIKYLIEFMNQKDDLVQNQKQQEERIIINSMFFKFSNRQGNQKSRYKQISLQKFLDLFIKLDLKQIITQQKAISIFDEAVSYKQKQKILCKQDFLTVIKKISEKVISNSNKNTSMPKFIKDYILPKKQLYQQEIHRIYNIYKDSIQKYIKKNRIQFCLKCLFYYKDQEQKNKYKDFYSIVQIFTVCSLLPPFESNKIHYFYSYICIDNTNGINYEQFKQVIIMVAISQQLGLRNIQGQSRVKTLIQGKDQQTIIVALDKFFNRYSWYYLGVIFTRKYYRTLFFQKNNAEIKLIDFR